VIGFDQTGASGTDSDQGFLFNFFISRPLPLFYGDKNAPRSAVERYFGPKFRIWGGVKVRSTPKPINSDLATFSSQFADTFGKLKVNELAESASFTIGPEFRIGNFVRARRSLSDETSAGRFMLTFFMGFGALGPNSQSNRSTVFQVTPNSTQAALLLPQLDKTGQDALSAALKTADTNKTKANIALLPDQSNRFLLSYKGGLRLYSFFADPTTKDPLASPPATIEFSIGQDQTVTESRFHGTVGHVSGMYPFPLGSRKDPTTVVLYFFGESTMAFQKGHFTAPVPLAPALDAQGNPVAVSDPSVTVIRVQSNRRDTYRIGVGLDLITVYKKLKK
jgi:hypothetical protein